MEQHFHTVILFHLVRTFIVYKAMPGLKYWSCLKLLSLFKYARMSGALRLWCSYHS